MQRRPLVLLLFAALAVGVAGCGAGGAIQGAIDGVGGGSGGGGGSPAGAAMSAAERAWALSVLDLVNTERGKAGAPPLAWHEAASQVAYAHAVDMDVRKFFAHDNPDGLDPGARLAAAGIVGHGWGENIAQGQPDPASVMADWMASDGHRANILNPAYASLGVGVHVGAGGPWWVQDFLTP